jgi:hypothetical protein
MLVPAGVELTFTLTLLPNDEMNLTVNYTVPDPKYTLAGSVEGIFGTWWDATNESNDMEYDETTGFYKKIYTNVPAGLVEFKIVKDHSWSLSYGDATNDSGNYTIYIPSNGATLTITFDVTNTKMEYNIVSPVIDTIYFVPNQNWKTDGAKFGAYIWNSITNVNTFVPMSDSNSDGIYECQIPDGTWTNVIFVRIDPNGWDSDNGGYNWNNKWNQTADLSMPTDTCYYYSMPEGIWNSGGDGNWWECKHCYNWYNQLDDHCWCLTPYPGVN